MRKITYLIICILIFGFLAGFVDRRRRLVYLFDDVTRTYTVADALLQENGDYLFQETGDKILIVDFSLGPELITDGDGSSDSFTINLTDWTYDAVNQEWDADGSAPSSAYLYQDNVLPAGALADTWYYAEFEVKNYSAGSVQVRVGCCDDEFGTQRTANGVYTELIKTGSATSNARFFIRGSTDFVGSVDNISLKQVLY